MIVAREVLDERIRLLISRLRERKSLYLKLNEVYNIPEAFSADICANRKDIGEVSDFIAFAFVQTLDNGRLNHYFTEDEIETYSKQKYQESTIEFPIIFESMVQVSADQWIGAISAKRLMEFKKAQLIKYNENTQRTLRKVVKGEDKYYKIAINKKSIREIKEAFENGSYISDDITLNIPLEYTEVVTKRKSGGVCDIVVDVPTDEKSSTAVMDILDGYHRYIAISQVVREFPDWDYPMEIRLVNFTEEKAKQFIYQKDQKTQMKRIDSEALNQFSPSNMVVDKLNGNPNSNIRGLISRNDGQIDYSFLSAVIASYYFADKRKKYSLKDTLVATNGIQNKFNALTTEDLSWLDHEYSDVDLQIIMFCFSKDICDSKTIRTMIEKADTIDKQEFQLNPKVRVKRKLINSLTSLLESI